MARKHVMIIVPSLNSMVTGSIALFFAAAVAKNSEKGFPFKFTCSVLENVRGYANARNTAAKQFLDSHCDLLWFIDNDIVLPGDTFDLLNVDADIKTMVYPFVETMCPAILNYKDLSDFDAGLVDIEPDENRVADVTATGLGCTIISREVLEDSRMRFGSGYMRPDGKFMTIKGNPDEAPPIFRFHMKPNGDLLLGEDFDFGIRARRLGYSLKIRLDLQCDHLKTVRLNEARNKVLEIERGIRTDTKAYAI